LKEASADVLDEITFEERGTLVSKIQGFNNLAALAALNATSTRLINRKWTQF